MSRLAIAFILALTTTAAIAQVGALGQSRTPVVTSANGTQPFLFDGRMRGDGARPVPPPHERHSNAGTIVVQPAANQPGQER